MHATRPSDDPEGDDPPAFGAPICPWCGVTALPGAVVGRHDLAFVCDEADCAGVGEPVGSAE